MEQKNYDELIQFAKEYAELEALENGYMSDFFYSYSIYEGLGMSWVLGRGGDEDLYKEHYLEAAEAFADAYANYFNAEWSQDSWGNYKFWVKE